MSKYISERNLKDLHYTVLNVPSLILNVGPMVLSQSSSLWNRNEFRGVATALWHPNVKFTSFKSNLTIEGVLLFMSRSGTLDLEHTAYIDFLH